MSRRFQFSLEVLLVWAFALPACIGALVAGVQADDGCGFLLAAIFLAFFAWVAIKQTKNPAYTMLGAFAFFFLWPIFLTPVVLLLAALGLIDVD